MKKDSLSQISENFAKEFKNIKNLPQLDALRVQYLGRKSGALTEILRSLKDLPLIQRKKIGPLANNLRRQMEEMFEKIELRLKSQAKTKRYFDITAPGKRLVLGRLHVMTRLLRQINEIFTSLGFEIVEGPELETEFNNFDALNIPSWHPARDMWQTFWLDGEPHSADPNQNHLLRTHTSPVQVRYMAGHTPPFRIIAPGRCFRYEATDTTHNFEFFQLEGLMVSGSDDPKVTLATLKGVLQAFLSRFFKKEVVVRFLPSYFPFVEPGVEVAMRCVNCNGRGCAVCRKEGWIELLGAGMVHPRVFEAVGYNPKEVQGFAFGMGLDRLAMMKYKISDIRLLYASDVRFLEQF